MHARMRWGEKKKKENPSREPIMLQQSSNQQQRTRRDATHSKARKEGGQARSLSRKQTKQLSPIPWASATWRSSVGADKSTYEMQSSSPRATFRSVRTPRNGCGCGYSNDDDDDDKDDKVDNNEDGARVWDAVAAAAEAEAEAESIG
jgi:hypothetical protein